MSFMLIHHDMPTLQRFVLYDINDDVCVYRDNDALFFM
jgi:hypothetical protein